MSALPRGGMFLHLLELVLCSIEMESRDLDFLLDGSLVLEILGIMGSKKGMHIRLTSQPRQVCMFLFGETNLAFCLISMSTTSVHAASMPNLTVYVLINALQGFKDG
jgi:hypothetical protein